MLTEDIEQLGGGHPVAPPNPEDPHGQLALACEFQDRRTLFAKRHADNRPDRHGGVLDGVRDESAPAPPWELTTSRAPVCVGRGGGRSRHGHLELQGPSPADAGANRSRWGGSAGGGRVVASGESVHTWAHCQPKRSIPARTREGVARRVLAGQ